MATANTSETSQGSFGFNSIEELFGALESPLLDYAVRLLKDPVIAEEIVHEAFTTLHDQFDKIHEPHRWLYRTVHCLALKHQRKTNKVLPLESENSPAGTSVNAPADAQPLLDDHIEMWAGIGLVRFNLQNLDERSRELIRLKFNDALSYQEISARTGLTVELVGQLLHDTLKGLATELARTRMDL